MGYLLDMVDQPNLSNQQDVVRNERRQSVENQPYGIVEEALFHQLFPKAHPYYAAVIGSHADIQAAQARRREELLQAVLRAEQREPGDRRRHRQGGRRRQLVEKYFGPLKRGPAGAEADASRRRRSRASAAPWSRISVELPRVYMAWITPRDLQARRRRRRRRGQRSSAAANRAACTRALVYEKQIAQDVSAYQQSMTLGSVFTIDATARPGHTAEELETAIDAELATLPQNGPEQARWSARATRSRRASSAASRRLGGFGGVADRLNMYNHYLGDPGYLPAGHRALRAVTPASVQGVRASSNSRRTRGSCCMRCPGQPDLGPPVPTPPKPEVARRRRAPSRSMPTSRGATSRRSLRRRGRS